MATEAIVIEDALCVEFHFKAGSILTTPTLVDAAKRSGVPFHRTEIKCRESRLVRPRPRPLPSG